MVVLPRLLVALNPFHVLYYFLLILVFSFSSLSVALFVGKGCKLLKSVRKQMRKTINPITDNLIILSVSNQENILPIWLSCSSVTTMFEKDFVSVSLVVFLPDHLRYSVFPCLLYHGTDDF